MDKSQHLFSHKTLKSFTEKVLSLAGLPREDADIAAEALIRANLEGVDSHGISRLAIYLKRIEEGRINAKPGISFKKKASGVLIVDGDNGLGSVVATRALDEGMKMAKETGIAGVGVNHSNHFGTASFYCQRACEHEMAAMAFTNSPPGIAPWGGREAYFGTNPISFGFPTGTNVPVIIDMSSSIVARGKIILAAKKGESIPDGWAIDGEGKPTTNADNALEGSVLPVGGAKGYALALAVEILSGVLSGAAFGPHVKSIYKEYNEKANVGHFFVLFDVEKFMPKNMFYPLIKQLITEIKDVPLAEGTEEILIPGERRAKSAEKKKNEGIVLPPAVVEELEQIGLRMGIPLSTF